MIYKVTLEIEVDDDHPNIDATGDASDPIKWAIEEGIHEDAYLALTSIEAMKED